MSQSPMQWSPLTSLIERKCHNLLCSDLPWPVKLRESARIGNSVSKWEITVNINTTFLQTYYNGWLVEWMHFELYETRFTQHLRQLSSLNIFPLHKISTCYFFTGWFQGITDKNYYIDKTVHEIRRMIQQFPFFLSIVLYFPETHISIPTQVY